jgi:hypothetical protein
MPSDSIAGWDGCNQLTGHELTMTTLSGFWAMAASALNIGRTARRHVPMLMAPTSIRRKTVTKTVALLACYLLAGRRARAEEAGQDPRVHEAKAACVSGDFQRGVQLLAELYLASSDPIWIFDQARCYQQNAQPTLALSRFQEFLRKSQGAPDEDIRDAQTYIAEIEAQQRGQSATSGTTNTLTLSKQNQATQPESGRGLRYTGVGVGILGVTALATGVVFSVLVRQTQNSVENQTKNDVAPLSTIDGKLADGHRYETLQWISYGVGAAAVVAGSVLYWTGATSAAGGPRMSSTFVAPVFTANGAGANLHMAF